MADIADDVVLTAIGPGAEQFHGRIDNTRVFRAMVGALGLGPKSSASIEDESTARR